MIAPMDDRAVGQALRALRRRAGWRQEDLARRAATSQAQVSRVERGLLDRTTVGLLRRLFGALGAGLDVAPSWAGGRPERLLGNERRRLVELVVTTLERAGWEIETDLVRVGAELGSVRLLAVRADRRAALVAEVAEAALPAPADDALRDAAAQVRERRGWRPSTVGRVIALPDTMRLRRAARSRPAAYPDDGRTIRAWVRNPEGALSGVWFLSATRGGGVRGRRRDE